MQTEIQLKTPDNHVIYGTLDSKEKSQSLIIFVHGITGNQNEHQYFNAAPFFTEKGFDAFRFDFYPREPNVRSLSEISITSHTQDLKLIIDNFKEKYQDLILIGHSLGGLVILNTDLTDISKIVLWDPTTGFSDIKEKQGSYSSDLDKYILHWGMDIIVSKQLIEEWKSLDINNLVEKLNTPCKFIFAGNTDKHKLWQPFLEKIKTKNEIVEIENATHCFTEEGTEQKLFQETFNWIKK